MPNDVEPELRCTRHADADEAPHYCADCNTALRIHTRWIKDREADAAQRERDADLERRAAQLSLAVAAIEECPLCDDQGYTRGAHVCDHVDHRETNRRGSALVRAELERLATERKSR